MSILVVYWIDPANCTPHYEEFPDEQMQIHKVLECCAARRAEGMQFITSAGESGHGGGIVKDGKLPNGEPYTWKKRRL